MNHFAVVTLHLFAAIMFAGTVFFEVLILEGVRRPAGRDVMRIVEMAIGRRARRVMPFVIVVLYLTGIAMALEYRDALSDPLNSSFGLLFLIKIILATSVFGHFLLAITASAMGRLKSRHFKLIHISVFAHMVLIILLAKAMFYISW